MWYRVRVRVLPKFFVAALLLSACGPPPNSVFVELCGDVQIPTDIDAVRVSILTADRSEHRTGTLDLLNCGSDQLTLPQTQELEAPFGDVWVVAQGLQDGVEVLHSERRLNIEDKGKAQDAIIALTRSCMRLQCSLGQTCIAGVCEQAPFPDDEVSCSGGSPSQGVGGGTLTCATGEATP